MGYGMALAGATSFVVSVAESITSGVRHTIASEAPDSPPSVRRVARLPVVPVLPRLTRGARGMNTS